MTRNASRSSRTDPLSAGFSLRWKANTRRSDLLARYGGEEFVMVAPSTDLVTARVLAERLRAAVEREPFTLGNAFLLSAA